jgi:hypothetical protein
MAIERDPEIRFHELGTLLAVTRWVTTHDEGLAEWLKNARRAIDRRYKPHRPLSLPTPSNQKAILCDRGIAPRARA